MLNFKSIPAPLSDLFKIILGIKVFIFLLMGALESFEDIKDTSDSNLCVDFKFESLIDKNINPEEAKAIAVNYCNGGG